MGTVSRRVRRPIAAAPADRSRWLALGIFALLAVAAPLAFGAVDRFTQIGLLGLLAIGVLAQPVEIARIGQRMNVVLLALLALVVFKEFGPAKWFGETLWRTTLVQSYGLDLPWTHHPEPARAFDALLACAAAAVWFAWVRTLASVRENRPVLAWSLFGAAAIVALVSFAWHGNDPQAIYGLRFTPGWRGFGPFPNRNHTACFFAMSAVLGAGCITWAAMKKRSALAALGFALLGLVIGALLTTQSRGGLIAFGSGALFFVGLVLLKVRDRRAAGVALAAALVAVAIALAFGSRSLSRFSSEESAHISNQTRIEIWHDALGMWKDAPLLGHGLGSFAQVFPMYQQMQLDDQVVLHPESSWLLWLAELGLLPILLGAGALAAFLVPEVREAFRAHHGFYLRAAGLAAAAGLLCHAAIDVPGHRWGTLAFALASLGMACPSRPRGLPSQASRKPALLAAGIALFWSMPLLGGSPAWSPLALNRLLARTETSENVALSEIAESLRFFPLNASLHQAAGLALLRIDAPAAREWTHHFQLAARLIPGSWRFSAEQARACRRLAPGFAIHAWQLAIERGGHQREDLLGIALRETAALPGAESAWSSYADAHPDLLLVYARTAPEPLAREAFARWWKERALDRTPPRDSEIKDFYTSVSRWGTPAQLILWADRHPDLRARDARTWAAIAHRWHDDSAAWGLLKSGIPEPAFPAAPPTTRREHLEFRWKSNPRDFVNARSFAQSLAISGDAEASGKIILEVARRPDAPAWFVAKGAYLLADTGRIPEAVSLLLREPAP